MALMIASTLLWVSCQKEVSNAVLETEYESLALKASGAVADNPSNAMKVPLMMSSEFAGRQFVTSNLATTTSGTASKGKPGSGGTADIKPPTVIFTSPSNAQTFNPGVSVSVQVSASDNVAVKSVSFNANGTVIGTLTTAPYNFTWNTGNVDGNYTLTATAADAAGNKTSTAITVSVKTPIVILPPPTSLPAAWQLKMPAVAYQGSESTCVPFAVVYYARSAEQYYTSGASNYSYASNIFSPEFVYNQTKASSSCSSGSSLLTTLDFLVSKGSCTWQSMPYNSADGCTLLPSSTQTNEAAGYKIRSYSKVLAGDQTGIKTMLASNHPLSFTFTADANFYNAGPGYIWNSYSSTFYGPHAITLCGYDDNKHAYRAINQWKTTWGDAGYIWIDYNFLSTITYDLYKINL